MNFIARVNKLMSWAIISSVIWRFGYLIKGQNCVYKGKVQNCYATNWMSSGDENMGFALCNFSTFEAALRVISWSFLKFLWFAMQNKYEQMLVN